MVPDVKSRRRKAINGHDGGTTTRRRLGTADEAAQVLHVSLQSLKNARSSGIGDLATLRWYKVGPRVLYDLDYLEGPWLEQRRRGHEAPEEG